MGKDNNNQKPEKLNQSGRKASSNSQSQPKTDCVLHFKDPKPNDESIKAKFKEPNGAKVSKQSRGWKIGDNKATLIALMNRLVSLGDMYEMWEDGKSKKLCQAMARALEGQV
jgi:regulatory protein YycI of two-component signal transduction system YycFG